ncbi:hypothetical protein ACFLQU_04045 [Verrucomicrobiota bacterium]
MRTAPKRSIPVPIICLAMATTFAVAADWEECEVGDVRVQSESWEKGFQERVKLLVTAKDKWRMDNPNRDTDVGKWTWSPLLAEMWKVRNDKEAFRAWIDGKGNEFIKSKWAGSYHKGFSAPGHCMYYFTFKDKLPGDQKQHAQDMIRSQGWKQMMRTDGHMDPIYTLTEFNSENYNWMERMAGVLWAEELGDRNKQEYFGTHLRNLTRALFNAGRVEWNSNNYWGHTFNPIMPLVTHVRDKEHRKRAWAIADWMAFEAALHYLDGFQVAVDTRAKTGAYRQFAGSVWAYSYLYFVGDRYHPTFPPAAVRDHGHFGSEVGYMGFSTYRPPEVAIKIARKEFKLPVEIQSAKPFYRMDNDNYAAWKGTGNGRRNEFETLYIGENFILASLATLRPNGLAEQKNTKPGAGGVCRPFSEQSVWRLGVKGSNSGAIQVYGNAGSPGGWGHGWDTMAGRQPWEQIGQYGPVMMRLWRSLDRGWVAVPLEAKAEIGPGHRIFCDMGRGVFFAVVPVRATGYDTEVIKGKKGKPGTHGRHIWSFNKAELGGLVLEVGTKTEHGSFDRFKKAMSALVPVPEGDAATWQSAGGKVLRVEHTGVTTYKMVDDSIVGPAGKLPNVWRDGNKVEYMKWNSYEVIDGERIIHQSWGSGEMTASAGGNSLRIVVTPNTARVKYFMK